MVKIIDGFRKVEWFENNIVVWVEVVEGNSNEEVKEILTENGFKIDNIIISNISCLSKNK